MLENLLISLRCVAPILICLVVGMLVRRGGFLSDGTLRQVNRFVFTFLFPQHIFNTVYNADFKTAFSLPLILFCIGIVSLLFVVSLFLLHRMKYSNREIGTLSQNAFRSNLNIIALPLAETLLGPSGLASMGIITAFVTPIYNLYAVITLEMHREDGKVKLGKTLLEIVKNPIVIGAAMGFLLRLLPFRLPDTIISSVASMGKAGSTLALILLGASFEMKSLISDRKRIIGGNLQRLVFAPLIAFLLALLVGLPQREIALVVLATGSPLATVSYTMCQVYDSDAELAAELVVTTSVLCCFTLFLWIFFLKQMGFA